MKRLGMLLHLSLLTLIAWANVTISGHVRSLATQEVLPDAEVHVEGLTRSVITNEDGFFSLKLDTLPAALTVTALGYKDTRITGSDMQSHDLTELNVWMLTDAHLLSTVTIFSAADIVSKALEKVPANFPSTSERLSCFYRETVRKQSHYVSLCEAVMDIYKTDYTRDILHDKVQIIKGRSLISQRAKDTVSVRVMGGPQESIIIDLVKNREVLFFPDDLPAYSFEMEPSTTIGNREQYVIRFHPTATRDYPLYSGLIYIDAERLAFTRIETSLDVSDLDKATNFMLRKKPRGLRFRPKALNTTVSYHFDGECSRLSYVRNVYLFSCDWRRRLFSTTYRAVSEMVVTDHVTSDIPRGYRNMFGRYDVLSSDVADFNDPAFWQEYNILEPSESLEHAVRRLKKRADSGN